MLNRLYIENIAVIEKAEIDFCAGLNVLTGETGAGKSILVDSIMAVLGARTSRELVRTGAQNAFVSAEFSGLSERTADVLRELGAEPEEGAVILSREIRQDGRGSCRINGRPVNVSTLREAGGCLIDIHGQHDSQGLLDPQRHMGYLDSMMDSESLLERCRADFAACAAAQKELSALEMDESEKARMIDVLRYQIEDIESAELSDGEMDRLRKRRERCVNFERIRDSLAEACGCLLGDEDSDGAVSSVKTASDAVGSLDDEELAPLCTRLNDAYYELDDIASELQSQLDRMEYDPYELEQIENRLDVLRRIVRKYGGEAEALDYCAKAKKKLERIELSDERRAELEKRHAALLTKAEKTAAELSAARKKTAEDFITHISEELRFLDMPSVRFDVSFEEKPLSADGIDKVEFLISANPGEPPRPISRIASGGELSRIMLAIKNVLADRDDIDTLIFDEVDTGVSGRAAHKIGVKLKSVSHSRQIICITHLAQIAANADAHLGIRKNIENGRTFTSVHRLSFDERVRELAAINGGENITDTMLATAEEMLAAAGIVRENA